MKLTFATVLGAVLVLIGIVALRTALITDKQIAVDAVQPASLDVDSAAERLARAIRHRTISYQEESRRTGAEFLRLHEYLKKAFPRVHDTLTREVVSEYSLLYTWMGASKELPPIILMAHLDVVPAEGGSANDWTYPPFAGRIANGYVWGRGSLDVKLAVTACLEAIEILIAERFSPQRTVYLALGHDEEVGGQHGAAKIAALLEDRGVRASFTLDEGSAIVDGVVPGVSQPVALVALAEKGYLTLELKVSGEGSHASMPRHPTTIGKLARAIHRLETTLMPTELKAPASEMLEFLASEMPVGMRAVVANRWLLEPLLISRLERTPATNALIRSTTAPTLLPQAGVKENVIPQEARALVNFRLLPGDTVAKVIAQVEKTIDDQHVTVTQLGYTVEASAVSNAESPAFDALHRTIRQVFPDVVVAPSLVVGATDSRHYANIAENSFRFLPMRLSKTDLKRIHGKDERISVENYADIIRFYIQLIKNTASP